MGGTPVKPMFCAGFGHYSAPRLTVADTSNKIQFHADRYTDQAVLNLGLEENLVKILQRGKTPGPQATSSS